MKNLLQMHGIIMVLNTPLNPRGAQIDSWKRPHPRFLVNALLFDHDL